MDMNDKFSFNDEQSVFDYTSLNGLGQSEYENDDLFLDNNTLETNNNTNNYEETFYSNLQNLEKEQFNYSENIENYIDRKLSESSYDSGLKENDISIVNSQNEQMSGLTEPVEINNNQEDVVEELPQESNVQDKITLSDTPLDELNKLTEYKEDKIAVTDIKSLFDRVGTNVKEASDIFKKNTEMKEKIDIRFEELKKLQQDVEKSKKSQYDEINSYKEDVLSKLTEKKEEIEKRLNKLKDYQSNLEKERLEFEQYKKTEKEEIARVQKEIQEAYDSRREELTSIEDKLRRQKDALDEERSQLSLDRIQYESDKNELANNLLKFNEIVDSFTNGIDKID